MRRRCAIQEPSKAIHSAATAQSRCGTAAWIPVAPALAGRPLRNRKECPHACPRPIPISGWHGPRGRTDERERSWPGQSPAIAKAQRRPLPRCASACTGRPRAAPCAGALVSAWPARPCGRLRAPIRRCALPFPLGALDCFQALGPRRGRRPSRPARGAGYSNGLALGAALLHDRIILGRPRLERSSSASGIGRSRRAVREIVIPIELQSLPSRGERTPFLSACAR